MEGEENARVLSRGEGGRVIHLDINLGFHNHQMCLKNNRQRDNIVRCIWSLFYLTTVSYHIPSARSFPYVSSLGRSPTLEAEYRWDVTNDTCQI